MKLREKIAPDSTAAPILSFGVRAASPKNVRGGSREIGADLPGETAKNSSEFSPPLAQERLAAAEPLDKIIPHLAGNRKILRENIPLVWNNWLKNVKNAFQRATVKCVRREPSAETDA